jgi:AcrR family transcriptional regulator
MPRATIGAMGPDAVRHDGEAMAAERIDGRRARRQRGRMAVIDAVFELLQEQGAPLAVEQVAERSGVSASSIFRYFGSLDDLQRQTFERFLERFEPLFVVPEPRGDSTDERVRAFVDARLELYATTGGILRVARLRALEYPQLHEAAGSFRTLLATQVRHHFAPEVAKLSGPARQAELVALIDSLASPEAWDCLVLSHRRSRRQIRTMWQWSLVALIETTGAEHRGLPEG